MATLDQLAYTTEQAAQASGHSVETIRAAIRSGDLRARKPVINGRELKRKHILRADLEAWLRGDER